MKGSELMGHHTLDPKVESGSLSCMHSCSEDGFRGTLVVVEEHFVYGNCLVGGGALPFSLAFGAAFSLSPSLQLLICLRSLRGLT